MVSLTKAQYQALETVSFPEGRKSSFKWFSYQMESVLLKVFQSKDVSYQKEQIKLLLSTPRIENSAYPLDEVEIEKEKFGYLCPYFPKTYSFSAILDNSLLKFSLSKKEQAILDTTEQLKMFHSYGFVLNDVRLSNHLLDKNGGHLVDFEDSGVVLQTQNFPPSIFQFYKEGKANPPSILEDKRKQALCHISLLLNVNLEHFLYIQKQNASPILFSLLKENKELSEMMEEVFFSDEVSYFDTYLKTLHEIDLEKQVKFGKQFEKKLKRHYKTDNFR